MAASRETDAINNVAELLHCRPEIRLAFAFGSVPAGRATYESDIDIAILAAEPLNADQLMHLTHDIAMLTGRPVDIIDLKTAGPLVGQQVLRNGKLLVRRNEYELGDFISRTIIDAADFLPLRNRAVRERLDKWIRE